MAIDGYLFGSRQLRAHHVFARWIALFCGVGLLAIGLVVPVASPALGASSVMPGTLTLTTNTAELVSGRSASLVAKSDVSISNSGYKLEIFEYSSGGIVASCSTGTTCSTSVSAGPLDGTRTYIARFRSLRSTPVTLTVAPWSISLVVDRGVVAAGQVAALRVATNQSVSRVRNQAIYIKDITADEIVHTCTSTSSSGIKTCSKSVSIDDLETHIYEAFVASYDDPTSLVQTTSNQVSIVPEPWTVSLAVDGPVVAADQYSVLRAVVNQHVHTTRNQAIYIRNVTTDEIVQTCSSSYAAGIKHCSSTQRNADVGPHVYEAFVADYDDPTGGIRAVSTPVSLIPAAWSVTLHTDAVVAEEGTAFTLRAGSNQDVHTKRNQAIYIKDVTADEIVHICTASGTFGTKDCSVNRIFTDATPHVFEAFVADYDDSTNGVVATSAPVSLSPAPWMVSLQTDRTVFRDSDHVTLFALANQRPYLTNYGIHIIDLTADIVVKTCVSATAVCRFDSTHSDASRQYQAVVAHRDDHTVDVQATSPQTITTYRAPWSVSLQSDRTVFRESDSVELIVRTNQDPYQTDYRVHIIDVTAGAVVHTCGGMAFPCEFRVSHSDASRQYQAVVAHRDDHTVDVQATSPQTITVYRAPWVVTLQVDKAHLQLGDSLSLIALPNQSLNSTGYVLYIQNISTGEVLKTCPSSTTCEVSTTYSGGRVVYQAVVASAEGITVDVQATSNGVSLPRSGGPTYPDETSGGSNPSESCSQPCVGDPVSTATGEFFDNITDLEVASPGPDLAWSLNYGSLRADRDRGQGYGWVHNFDMRIDPVDAPDLDSAPRVKVVQENASTLYFDRNGAGGFSAPLRVFADLEVRQNGNYVLTRRHTTRFVFDADGRLIKVKDRNGNALDLSYSGDQLTQIANDFGHSLTVSWAAGRVSGVTDQSARSVSYSYSAAGDLVQMTAPDGATRAFNYDGQHRITSVTDTLGGVTTNTYDMQGRVTEQVDPLGRTITFAYSFTDPANGTTTLTAPHGVSTRYEYADAQVVAITRAVGTSLEATTRYVYGPTNQPVLVTDPLGRVTAYSYDMDGNRIVEVDPLGRTRRATYDRQGNILSETDPAGNTTILEYDQAGNLVKTTSPTGAVTEFDVDSRGFLSSVEDALGSETSFTYDSSGYQIGSVDPTGAVTTKTFDQLGNPVTVIDPRGNEPGADPEDFTTEFDYDAMGRLLSATDPLGAVSEYEYDAADNVVLTADALGSEYESQYDLAGQLIKTTNALGGVTEYTYDLAGRVTAVKNPRGYTTQYGYDVLDRRTSVTDPLGHSTTFEYDLIGNLTAEITPLGKRTEYAYDAASQLISVEDPLGATTTYTYDQAGRVKTVTDPGARVTGYTYNQVGQVTKVTLPDNTEETNAYDLMGNLVSVTDRAGQTTSYAYDAAGQRISMEDSAGRVTEYEYDSAGNNTLIDVPGPGTISHAYDAVDNLLGIDYSDATPDVTFVYDALGRELAMTDGIGTSTTTYDAMSRITAHTRQGQTINYTYDANGNRQVLTYPNGSFEEHYYDAVDRLELIYDINGDVFLYEHNGDGDITSVTYPHGLSTGYEYDGVGRTKKISTGLSDPAASLDYLEFSYQYDPQGTLWSSESYRDSYGRSSFGIRNTTISYDPLDQVTTVGTTSMGGFSLPDGTENFATNTMGLPEQNGSDGTLTYTPHGQLATRITGDQESTYGFDARGNRTSDETESPTRTTQTTYTYDLANRLTEVDRTDSVSGTSSHSYQYYGDGLRATQGGAAQIWDITNNVPLLLADGVDYYLYGHETAPLIQNEAYGDSTTAKYLHTDNIGSVRMVTMEDWIVPAIRADGEYGTYGQTHHDFNSLDHLPSITRFGYAGEYTDPTGLIYLRNRYYDPVTAQFLSVDPIVDVTGEPYSYASGNPIQNTDPLGLMSWDWFWEGVEDAGNWSAGFGDTYTGGATKWVREKLGAGNAVDYCSDFYKWGGHGGDAAGFGPGGAGQALKGAKKLNQINKARRATNSLDEVWPVLSRTDLNPNQLSNFKRYTKKLPKGADEPVMTRGTNGTVRFSADVPGRVPGSYATYTKVVDSSGKTIGYTKTTVAPDGRIVHIKDKL